CKFRAQEAFCRREVPPERLAPGVLLGEDEFRIKSVVLDHGTPCLAFAFEEKVRVNVWSEGLSLLRLGVGPWLNEAKRAMRRGAPDESAIVISHDLSIPLGLLKQHALRTAQGQRIAYVVDAAYHDRNVERIIALARGADQLFIEAAFLDEAADIAAQRQHPIYPIPLLGPLPQAGEQASKRGGASLPRVRHHTGTPRRVGILIVLFTDFGLHGPYTGQVKAVLHQMAPGIPVVDLFADAPVGNPKSSAYLLAAYAEC